MKKYIIEFGIFNDIIQNISEDSRKNKPIGSKETEYTRIEMDTPISNVDDKSGAKFYTVDINKKILEIVYKRKKANVKDLTYEDIEKDLGELGKGHKDIKNIINDKKINVDYIKKVIQDHDNEKTKIDKEYTDDVLYKIDPDKRIISIYDSLVKKNDRNVTPEMVFDVFNATSTKDLKNIAHKSGVDKMYIHKVLNKHMQHEKMLHLIKVLYIIMIVCGAIGGMLASLRGMVIQLVKNKNKKETGNARLTDKQEEHSLRLLILSRVMVMTGAIGGAVRTYSALLKHTKDGFGADDIAFGSRNPNSYSRANPK